MRAAPAILLGIGLSGLAACTSENDDSCYQTPGLCDDAGALDASHSSADGAYNASVDMSSRTDAMAILDGSSRIDQGLQADTGGDQDAAPADARVGAPDFAIDGFVPPVDASAPIDAAPPTPDAFVLPADACRIQILQVTGGADNLPVFCGPGTEQVPGYVNDYILGPNGICNAQAEIADGIADGVADKVWVLVSPTRATFEQEGDCSNTNGGSGLTIFSGDRTDDVPTNEAPRRTAEILQFIADPAGENPTLIVEGGDEDIVTHFDASGTNLNPQR